MANGLFVAGRLLAQGRTNHVYAVECCLLCDAILAEAILEFGIMDVE